MIAPVVAFNAFNCAGDAFANAAAVTPPPSIPAFAIWLNVAEFKPFFFNVARFAWNFFACAKSYF